MNLVIAPKITNRDRFLAIPLFFEKKKFDLKNVPAALKKIVEARIKNGDLEPKNESVCTVISDRKLLPPKLFLHVCGERKKWNANATREFAAVTARIAKQWKTGSVSFLLDSTFDAFGQALAEGVMLANFSPAKYKTGKEKQELQKMLLTEFRVIRDQISAGSFASRFKKSLEKGVTIAHAVNEIRHLANAPSNLFTPATFEEQVVETAKRYGYKVTIFRKKDLEKMGMGALLAVNRGSTNPEQEARLAILEHLPLGPKVAPTVLVGKGIVFDTGGYNLKPSRYILEMQLDKSGALAVLGVFMLLQKLNVQKNAVGIMAITENLVSATSYRPEDIVTTYSGKTVEVKNTDAEGRMVLADAVAYGAKQYKPKYLIDIATLTGACEAALGDRYAGIFWNDRELKKLLLKAGRATDELLWPLPLHKDYKAKMKGKIADLTNDDVGSHHLAGASKGAAFIEAFVGKAKWAHLDIAGVAYANDPKKYESNMGTGFGVRLMLHFLENL